MHLRTGNPIRNWFELSQDYWDCHMLFLMSLRFSLFFNDLLIILFIDFEVLGARKLIFEHHQNANEHLRSHLRINLLKFTKINFLFALEAQIEQVVELLLGLNSVKIDFRTSSISLVLSFLFHSLLNDLSNGNVL